MKAMAVAQCTHLCDVIINVYLKTQRCALSKVCTLCTSITLKYSFFNKIAQCNSKDAKLASDTEELQSQVTIIN
jgi:hypothetical protein